MYIYVCVCDIKMNLIFIKLQTYYNYKNFIKLKFFNIRRVRKSIIFTVEFNFFVNYLLCYLTITLNILYT